METITFMMTQDEIARKIDEKRNNKYVFWKYFSPLAYVKELRKLEFVDSVNACLVMAKLEVDFKENPNPFCRYTMPCKHQEQLGELCWTDELAISETQFIEAFDEIGVRYECTSDFMRSQDRFKGKYYCSVIDKNDNDLPYYFRNKPLVKCRLKRLEEELYYERVFDIVDKIHLF